MTVAPEQASLPSLALGSCITGCQEFACINVPGSFETRPAGALRMTYAFDGIKKERHPEEPAKQASRRTQRRPSGNFFRLPGSLFRGNDGPILSENAVWRRLGAALAVLLLGFWPRLAPAYTAAGDRIFPALILLPQVAPADEFYLPFSTEPVPGGRDTNQSAVFAKTLTERLGIQVEEGYDWEQRNGMPTATGWQNLQTTVKYLVALDPEHEALLSVGVNREWGGSGTSRIDNPKGATTPTVYVARGFGDAAMPLLRPFAVEGTFGYQVSDALPRPDKLETGIAIEYSLPYLESKVSPVALPAWLAATTPIVETFLSTPTRYIRGGGETATTIGPGLSYAGEGWELAIEALVPATRAAGTGLGVTAQLHLALDFLLPDSLGKPLIAPR
jgi:hypothetical protein